MDKFFYVYLYLMFFVLFHFFLHQSLRPDTGAEIQTLSPAGDTMVEVKIMIPVVEPVVVYQELIYLYIIICKGFSYTRMCSGMIGMICTVWLKCNFYFFSPFWWQYMYISSRRCKMYTTIRKQPSQTHFITSVPLVTTLLLWPLFCQGPNKSSSNTVFMITAKSVTPTTLSIRPKIHLVYQCHVTVLNMDK